MEKINLGLVAAREGSKGIPKKKISLNLMEKPLLVKLWKLVFSAQ